jgi:hypothetical protein
VTFEQGALWLVSALGVYAGLGVLFAVPFAFRGVERIDPSAKGASWGFRLIILPGAIALWPMLLRRWLRHAPPPVERNAHRAAAGKGAA